MRSKGALVAFALAMAPGLAAAGEPSPTDVALAQTLFEEGTAAMRDGRYDEACPKLAESQHLDPGGGTLINLAVCLEKQGRHASAYLAYQEALAVAERDGNRQREIVARERIAAVTPLLSRVTVRASKDALATRGLEVRLDGAVVRPGGWGAAAPVDPGEHVISASAPGKRDWSRAVRVDAPGTQTIEVPALEDLPRAAPLQDARVDATPARPGPQRAIGFGLLVGAGVATVVGGVAGIVALSRHADSTRVCSGGVCTSPDGIAAERDADALAWGANVAFGIALASAGVGTLLVLTAPRASAHVAIGPRSIVLRGTF